MKDFGLLADIGYLVLTIVMLVEARSTGPPIVPPLGIVQKLPKGLFFHNASSGSREKVPATPNPTTGRCVPPMPRATSSKG